MRRFSLVLACSIELFGASSCSKERASAPAAATTGPSESEGPESEQSVPGQEGDSDQFEVAPSTDGAHGSAGVFAEATHVLETMTASNYSHKTYVSDGAYNVDCSGFADYVLGRVDAPALVELRAATVKRPLAKHFVQFFSEDAPRRYWQRITRVADLVPGDIIAWEKPADVTSSNTGHVMIVSAAPLRRPPSEWVVPIIDSTAAPHGKGDARKQSHTTGVGRGTVVLEADVQGAPIAYHWTELRHSPRHTTKIALGRAL